MQFECRKGRVTFIDVGALVDEVKSGMRAKGEELRTTWEVSDVVGPIGPFQLRYTLERERDSFPGDSPDRGGSYRFGLSAWYVEPVTEVRGETLEQALKPGSEFRQIVDGLDPQYAAVTFWVYPDSFPLYRQLRDYLYERDLVVAGRPLPAGDEDRQHAARDGFARAVRRRHVSLKARSPVAARISSRSPFSCTRATASAGSSHTRRRIPDSGQSSAASVTSITKTVTW